MLPEQGGDGRGDGIVRLLPGGLAQPAVAAHQGRAQPVGIGVELPEGGPLGADETAAEHVLAVTAGAGDGGASMVRVSPQVASQRGQMRRAVRGMGLQGGQAATRAHGRPEHTDR